MFNDYLSLEIAHHTALSDTQYLKLNLSWPAEICSSIGQMPKLHMSPNILKCVYVT